jgi:hypothetical protein
MRSKNLLPALLFALAAFVAYALTAAPGMLYGDAGEFQFTLPLAGVSHPTGYPLFHILGWVWEQAFTSNPAWGANLFSAFWGGVAVGAFYLFSAEAIQRLIARMKWRRGAGWLAGITTVVFAFNPTFWAQATQAEVYTMHAAFVAAILGATMAAARERDAWPIWPVALLLGLGLAHHLTTLFLIPGVALALWLARPAAFRPKPLQRTLPWLLAPLLLYLYIPLRAPASPWLFPQLTPERTLPLFDNTLAGHLRFILGIGFSGELGSAPLTAQIAAAGKLFLTHFTWAGLALILLGLAALVIEGELLTLILTGVSFLLLLLFNLFYGIGDIAVYYIPLYLIGALWLGLGLTYIVEGLTRMTSPQWRLYWMAAPLLALALPFSLYQTYHAQFDRSRDRAARTQWETILAQPLADDAALVSNDRDEMVPLIYLQQVEGRTPGMLGLFPKIAATPDWEDLNVTLKSALATGRPTYVIKSMPGIEALYQVQAAGVDVWRVEGPQPAPPDSFEAPYTENLRWLGIDWAGQVQPGGTLEVTIYWRAVQRPDAVWHSFLHLYDAAGEKAAQAEDHRPGGDYLPSTLWRPGDVIADQFEIALPAELVPGEYTLMAGFYDPATGGRIAEPLPVGVIRLP